MVLRNKLTGALLAYVQYYEAGTTDDIASLRIAATLGVGVAMLPREFVDDDLRSGPLRRLVPELTSKPALVHAIFPTRRGMVPAVRHLLDALVSGYEKLNRK